MTYEDLKTPALKDRILEWYESGYLKENLPEIYELSFCEQNKIHHPEGNAFEHTILAIENCKSNDYLARLCVLFHDIGKTVTYQKIGDKHTYYGHDKEGVKVFYNIKMRLKVPTNDSSVIEFCIRQHMRFKWMTKFAKQRKVLEMIDDPRFPYLVETARCDCVTPDKIAEHERLMEFVKNFKNK